MTERNTITELQERIALYEDMKAYRQLFDLLFPRLYRFAHSFTKSKETAEEIVSDVFIKLWEMGSSLTAVANLTVYLYTITKNFSLNYLTRSRKLKVRGLDEISEEAFLDPLSPEDVLISAETVQQINAAINTLPPQCRLVFFSGKGKRT